MDTAICGARLSTWTTSKLCWGWRAHRSSQCGEHHQKPWEFYRQQKNKLYFIELQLIRIAFNGFSSQCSISSDMLRAKADQSHQNLGPGRFEVYNESLPTFAKTSARCTRCNRRGKFQQLGIGQSILWSKMAAKNDKRQRYSIHLYTLHIFCFILVLKIGTPQT